MNNEEKKCKKCHIEIFTQLEIYFGVCPILNFQGCKDEELCFFHLMKDVILNKNVDEIKLWLNKLYNKSKKYYIRLLYNFYPKLLKQKAIHKRTTKDLTDITNHILELAKIDKTMLYPECLTTYLKYVKIDTKLINTKSFTEKHFFYCIQKQELSLDTSLFYCHTNKKATDIKNIIDFYRNRDRIILKSFYFLSTPVVIMIIDALG